jgi:hypothetical protein
VYHHVLSRGDFPLESQAFPGGGHHTNANIPAAQHAGKQHPLGDATGISPGLEPINSPHTASQIVPAPEARRILFKTRPQRERADLTTVAHDSGPWDRAELKYFSDLRDW